MPQPIGDRIRDVRKQAELSQIEFADRVGIRQSSLSQIEKGVIKPSLDTLEAIVRHFEISFDYLMGATSAPVAMAMQPAAYVGAEGQFALVDQTVMGGRFAGFGDAMPAGEAITYPGLEGGVAVRVEGNSMEPTLKPGDVLLCTPLGRDGYLDNRVYVIVTRDGALVKRVLDRTRAEGVLLLKSDNRDFATQQIRREDVLASYVVRRRITADLSGPDEMHDRLSQQEQALHDLHAAHQQMQEQFAGLMRGLTPSSRAS